MLLRYIPRARAWTGIAILAAAAVCVAQPVHSPVPRAHRRGAQIRTEKGLAPAAAKAVPAAATQPQPERPLTPLEQPPQPATITLTSGRLAIRADNSSLIEIVNQLGKDGGMSISGLSQDQRVFGVYGPGDPRQILTQLLEGAGYNVLMLGITKEGTPRQLVLSARGNAPPSSPDSFPQEQEPSYQPPLYQRQPMPPQPGNLNFPMRSPAQYQQMMQQREQQRQQQQPQ